MTAAGRSSWIRWVLVTVILTVLFLGGAWLAVLLLLIQEYSPSSSFRIAEYDGLSAELAVDDDRVLILYGEANAENRDQPGVYIAVTGHPPVPIAELSEALVATIATEGDWSIHRYPDNRNSYLSSGVSECFFKFENGELRFAMIGSDESPFKMGPGPDGPIVAPPVPIDDFLRIFGEPRKWSKGQKRGAV